MGLQPVSLVSIRTEEIFERLVVTSVVILSHGKERSPLQVLSPGDFLCAQHFLAELLAVTSPCSMNCESRNPLVLHEHFEKIVLI